MDRSFLSRSEVVAVSRQFVCVRLATYEDKGEGDYLKAFQVTRSGQLENTVFTILSPDGKKQLARASRSAFSDFDDAADMAAMMQRVAGENPTEKPAAGEGPELPTVANVRLAVNVAACDNQPLVVVFAGEENLRRGLAERLAPLAWGDPFIGRFVYATTGEAKELAKIKGVKVKAGVLVVQPDRFGLEGKVLAQYDASTGDAELVKCLTQGMALHKPEDKTFGSHVRAGQQQGVFWDTVISVTDPMEQAARERGRLAPK